MATKKLETLVVASKVKAHAKSKGKRFSGEAIDALSDLVRKAVENAAVFADQDGRETIKARDFKIDFKVD